GSTGYSLPMQAPNAAVEQSTLQFHRPILTSRGAPGDRTGGGSRDGITCSAFEHISSEDHLTALVPEQTDANQISQVWALTTASSPVFWFYVPYLPSDIDQVQFELWDETLPNPRTYHQIYQGSVTIDNTPGIIHLPLPQSVQLEPDRYYHWYLSVSLDCHPQDETVVVNGWIQRVTETMTASTVLREQAIASAENGIWQDALTILAQLRSQNPDDEGLMADWQALLAAVGLEDLDAYPLLPCCSLKTP
ncbi:MAG TPA: DUF928 domain-containing protein, partial [Allocoleopsis sp.]